MIFSSDERAQALNERSGQIAFLTSSILLAVAAIYRQITSREGITLLLILLATQASFWISKTYYRRKGL